MFFSLSNNTLWNVLEEPNIINASEFEDLFAKTTTQTKRKPLSEAYEKKAKARKVTHKINLDNMQDLIQFTFWVYLQWVIWPLEGDITIANRFAHVGAYVFLIVFIFTYLI